MSHTIFDMTDRVALVTGAASGMGKAMAVGFAESGADLMLADVNEPGAQETAHEIESLGRRAIPVRCDVSDVDQVRGMFSRLDGEFGRIDVLGNVAGATMLGKPEDLTLDQLQESMQSLVIARFCSCQEGGRRMLAAGKGSIINIGSLASLTAIGRGHVAYSIGMGAVAQMTRELSTEWSSRGVRVNAILPAQVMNPFLEKRLRAEPRMADTWLGGIPAGRFGEPRDIVGVAIFLASDASAWVTGVMLPMDGGNLAMNAGGTYPGGPIVSG